MALRDHPAVSVVIPVHHPGDDFHRCIKAVEQADPPPYETIVVVDGAAEGDGAAAAKSGARAILLPARGGPARARNHGARAATGDIVLFVDSDVLIAPDTIGRVAAIFANETEVAAVFGSYDDKPAAPNFLSQYKNLLHHYTHQHGRPEASTFWAGCGAVRRSVFLEVGGFDERYDRPSIEDIELGYRLRQAGRTIRLCKDLQVTHLKRWTAVSLLRSDINDRALPWAELILRRGAMPNDLNLKVADRASAVLAWAGAALLTGGVMRPFLLAYAFIAFVLLWLLNAPLYRFFCRKRGVAFMFGSIGWHWLYYLYSSAAFAWTFVSHWLQSSRSAADKAASSLERP
jgi:GT2 family glycosyltransferase